MYININLYLELKFLVPGFVSKFLEPGIYQIHGTQVYIKCPVPGVHQKPGTKYLVYIKTLVSRYFVNHIELTGTRHITCLSSYGAPVAPRASHNFTPWSECNVECNVALSSRHGPVPS